MKDTTIPTGAVDARTLYRFFKRALDLVSSAIGLLIFAPLIGLVAVLIKLTSPGPAIFRQTRVGMRFREFEILKFRTMRVNAGGTSVTTAGDSRITKVGAFLRKFKLDELPQLWNVLVGHMSVVGPRPEVPEYVEKFRAQYSMILRYRPGITDPSSIKFRSEAELLGRVPNPDEYYERILVPEKLKIASAYQQRATLWSDLAIVFKTILVCFQTQEDPELLNSLLASSHGDAASPVAQTAKATSNAK